MKNTKIPMALGLITLLVLFPVCTALQAQDFAPTEQNEKTGGGEEIVLQGDQGIELLQEKQAGQHDDFESRKPDAFQKVREYIYDELEMIEGWHDEKKVMFTIGTAEVTVKNPATEKEFLLTRELMYKQAYLRAKTQIAKNIMTKFSGEDLIDMPGNDVNKEFGRPYAEALGEWRKQARVVDELLAEKNKSKKVHEKGVTNRERLERAMDWALKELDKTYDPKKIKGEKLKRYQEAKRKYLAAKKKLDGLQAEANQLRQSPAFVQKSKTSISTPLISLHGASVYWSQESWLPGNDNAYQVAVLVMWSKGMRDAVAASLLNKKVAVSAPAKDSPSLSKYVRKEMDLPVMSGGHVFVDEDGQCHFLGISAHELPKTSIGKARARTTAKLNSFQACALSAIADVTYQADNEQQLRIWEVSDDEEIIKAMQSTSEKAFQGHSGVFAGLQEIYQTEGVQHHSQKRIHISVHHLSPTLAAKACKLMAEGNNVMTAVMHQSMYYAGYADGLAFARITKGRDISSYIHGFKSAIVDSTGGPNLGPDKPKTGPAGPDKPKTGPVGPKKPKPGVVGPKKPKKLPF